MLVTPDNAADVLNTLSRYRHWTVDTETTGLNPYTVDADFVVGVAIQAMGGRDRSEPYYFPFRHTEGNIDIKYMRIICDLMATRRCLWFWNAAFDLNMMWNEGLTHDLPQVRDVMLDLHLVNENLRGYGLKQNAVRFVNPQAGKADRELDFELASALLPSKGDMYRLHPQKCAPYACDDVVLTTDMALYTGQHLHDEGTTDVACGVGGYAIVAGEMARRGFQVDRDFLSAQIGVCNSELARLTMEARDLAGRPINLSSPKVISAWLNIDSTDAYFLEAMAATGDERAKLVLQARVYMKAKSAYYRPFLKQSELDSCLHPDILLYGTISGRAAVREPPLQSLPRDVEQYKVKESIVARDGFYLLRADYSQAEIRLACHYGKEERMADIIRSGRNMHRAVSDEQGIPYSAAKRINFSVIYGIGGETLGHNLGISTEEATGYLRRYHTRYPGFRTLYRNSESFASRYKYIPMWTGRRRHYTDPLYRTPTHKASSNLIQGGVAEMMRVAQTRLRNELRGEGVRQILQVHDDAVMEVPIDRVEELAYGVREIMTYRDRFSLPMTVDVKWGRTMADTVGSLPPDTM